MKEFPEFPEAVPPSEPVPPADLKRAFSKEFAQGLRDETARELWKARHMPGDAESLRAVKKGDRPEYEPRIQEAIKEAEKLTIGRLFKTFEFKASLQDLDGMLARARASRIEKVRFGYEDKLKKVLAESPLSEPEMEQYLNERAMEAMSLENYLTLMQRLSGNFVTHVTRQGIRERTGGFHRGGMGEFFHSFEKVLEGKKLQSFLANFMTDPNSIQYLVGSIRDAKKKTGLRGEALVEKILDAFEKTRDENMPADRSSVHMATNDVAADFYGTEKGYDFYFYFPAEFIAYNYFHHHKGMQNSVVDRKPGLSGAYNTDWTDKHNDLGVWNNGSGVPIEAGITCIPKDVMVDKETGSQYKLIDGKPIRTPDGSGYELSENTMPSQDYWEQYFAAHPDLRPNKVIYGNFQTMPTFRGTEAYQELFRKNVFRTSEDLPQYDEASAGEFAEFKVKLADFIRGLEEDGVI